ncbi:hypothetical protein Agub_g3283 [Astrephomene gubernaculifera]|uniref:Elongation factor Ts, mitochondrial n=1 Tax=Astrephomene gubernaculifera TaxID=47775 RepID=A0AAD3DKV7_9CHLO|nr:hypothetical protein Agub_g3283 [Astrephomene gubernaculifera]
MSLHARSSLQQLAGALLGCQSRLPLLAQSCSFSSSGAPKQSAAIIKQLRERSGAPIADVKNMLVEHDWDMEKAYEALRKKGLAAAAKKASRHAAEGLVGASFAASGAASSSTGGSGSVVVVELNSETDFVARNSMFQDLLRDVMGAAHSLGPAAAVGPDYQMNLEQLLSARTSSGASVSEAVTNLAAQVRENIRLRRAYRVDSGADGLVFPYVHQAAAPGLGKLASVVVLQPGAAGGAQLGQALESSSASSQQLQSLGEGLAMHVAGMRPLYLNRAGVPADVMARERDLLGQQLQQDETFKGKPEKVINKVVEGRLGKVLGDWCLSEQRYVLDDSVSVEQLLARLRKEAGLSVRVGNFLRVQCGEGLGAKEGGDFAAEVARIVNDA